MRNPPAWLADLLGCLGVGLVAASLAAVAYPLALAWLGIVALVLAVLLARKQGAKR